MNRAAYLIMRSAIGISLLGHGLVRLPKIAAFSHWMAGTFKQAMIPQAMVVPFGYILPFAEFGIGLLLLLGLFYRQALVAGSVVMSLLIFGSCMVENWDAIPSQLIHVGFFVILLQFKSSNSHTLDHLLFKKTIQ